jgi:hypothetical protein
MYMVISRWRPNPGSEDEMLKRAIGPRETLRAQPGVLFVYAMLHGDEVFVCHGYSNETMYKKVVEDPEGAFARSLAQSGLEQVCEWVESWRGESLD